MFLSHVWRRLQPHAVRSRGHSPRAHGRRSQAPRLGLEALEDRCLLSPYNFALLADNGPNSIFSLGSLNQPGLNDEGTVMFHSALTSGTVGVFTIDRAGSLRTIALSGSLANDFPLGGAITDRGTVSFGVDLAGNIQAVFTGNGKELTRIADTGPDSPFSSFLPPAAPINNEETVAFRATLKSGGTGIFTDRAGEEPRILYVTGGRFSALLTAPIIQREGDEVSFRATLNTGQDGVFLGDGKTTTTIATTGGIYRALSGGVTNDEGEVAFIANLTSGGQAIVTGDGTHLTTIAETGSRFSSFFGNATINNRGQVVFAANLAGGNSGIFIAQHGKVDEIIGTHDPLFGSTVETFTATPFAPRGFNNAGELGFAATLEDRRTVIVRADPLRESDDSTESDPARIHSGRGASSGSPRLSPDDMNAAVATAPIASLQPLATPTTLPATLTRVSSDAPAPESIGVPPLDASQWTTNPGDTLTRGPVRDLAFTTLDPAWSAWDPLTEGVTEW
jgi:hypothetical protein